jgi:hypothetical protein
MPDMNSIIHPLTVGFILSIIRTSVLMDQTNRFSLMLEALTELVAEEKQTRPSGPAASLPPLREVIASAAPLPQEALFLGLAEDGLPVLLNLHDPIPGPLLLTGDQASGKTALMQTISSAIDLMHSPAEVEYGVITDHPEDWQTIQASQNCAGLYSTKEDESQDFIESLVAWAHNNKGESQSVILFIDNLETAIKLGHKLEQNIRWLLLRGPSRRVWPIVSLNAGHADQMRSWLGFFRTRLFGHIQDPREAETITGVSDVQLDELIPGSQFTMREGNSWLNFWIPRID